MVPLAGELLNLHLQLVGGRILDSLLSLLCEHCGDPPLKSVFLSLQGRHDPVLAPELLMKPLGGVEHLIPLLGKRLHLGLRGVQGLLEGHALPLQGGILLLTGFRYGDLACLNGSAQALPLSLSLRCLLLRCRMGLPQLLHSPLSLGKLLLHLLPSPLRRRTLRGLLRSLCLCRLHLLQQRGHFPSQPATFCLHLLRLPQYIHLRRRQLLLELTLLTVEGVQLVLRA
mmetsp:Transcript_23349/g.53247  ORF Transcript_23349/g.53247 Transcript_23349/m.53247 type:complete len:227 (+) Transcript_23349:2152-2832(+)